MNKKFPIEVTKVNIHLVDEDDLPEDTKILAFANVELNDLLSLRDIRILMGAAGPFVSYPVSSGYKTYPSCFCAITRDFDYYLKDKVLTEYLYEELKDAKI